jgi:PAS domain S-box-containing protein
MANKSSKLPQQSPSGQRTTIGLLCDNLTSDFAAQLLLGVADATKAHSSNLLCFPGGALRDPNGLRMQSNVLYDLVSQENIDGLLVMSNFLGTYVNRAELLDRLFDRYRPLPIISIGLELANYPAILVDNYAGMYAAVTHLIEQHGYQRIAFIRGPHGHEEADARYKAYQDALTSHGLPLDPTLVATGNFLTPSGEAAVITLLDEQRANCQAIVTANDLMAFGALTVLKARHIRVPYDIAVVGFDDMEITRYTSPPLTTVKQPVYEIGKKIVEMLLAVMAGEDVSEQVLMPTELVVRQSCGCVNPAVAQAISGPVELSSQRFQTLNTSQREIILKEMQQTLGIGTQEESGWLIQLLDAFVAELNGQKQGEFIIVMDETLRQVMLTERPIPTWSRVLSTMRRSMLPFLTEDQILSAEDLWLPAQVMISEMAQQKQQSHTSKLEQQIQVLNEMREALITTFDIQELMNTIAREISRLDIPGCYLSLYEDLQHPIKASRLMLAYDEKRGNQKLPDENLIFASPLLVPARLMPQDRPYRMVVEPLYFRDEQLGFALLEMGPREGNVYDTLRGEISSALQSALLVRRIQERSAELARQQYILDTFMESVPDRIYFKDTESRFTRANKAMIQKAGLTSADEMIGKSDFDFFPPEQAQKKYQEEQEIMRGGQPVLSLKEADGIDNWASTTKMPLRDENGRIIGTFGISRDITELVRAGKIAERAKEEAEEAKQRAETEQQKAEAANRDLAAQIWQTVGQAQLNERMRGEQDISTLADHVIEQLCEYLTVPVGALYTLEGTQIKLAGTYAYRRKNLVEQFELGEGLVGQAAKSRRIINMQVPEEYTKITSASLGEIMPRHVIFAPLVYDGQVVGVVEMGTLSQFQSEQLEFLNKALESVAIAFMTAQARTRVNELFTQTRQQAEELQAQEEELRATNEELEAQTDGLRASETRLKQNQTALEAANVDLEEKTRILQEKQEALDRQNQALRNAQQELERKAEELTLASRYKSEFLANMSHELRTPLNSMLILAGMLAKNDEGNLTPDQTESAQVIYSGGNDLLNLINEILDLAKVEAGKMEFHFAPMEWDILISRMRAQFDPLSQRKELEFVTSIEEGLPPTITTDDKRLAQIVKNLLSNAFKFTEKGSITLAIHRPVSGSAYPPGQFVAVSVTDTGIGMSPDQQKVVFEAFQQADGSTSRQYGGTGLGLAIAREMTLRLGGQVILQSEYGKGSTFTIYLPLQKQPDEAPISQPVPQTSRAPIPEKAAISPRPGSPTPAIPDDRDALQGDDRILLIVEDDPKFARVVLDYAHKKAFKCLVAADGETALDLLKSYRPQAIVLDLGLPNISGWEVLDVVKNNPDTRHIPIHIISANDEDISAFQRGAMSFLTKPVSQEDLEDTFGKIEQFITSRIKSLLLVEDDDALRMSVRKLIEGSDVAITETSRGQAALDALAKHQFDCMILDLSLPDMNGFELLNRLHNDDKLSKCPIIVYTGKALSEEENSELLKYAESVIVKGARSPERLLDETALFLHRVIADLPEEKQRTIRKLHNQETTLEGKLILVVDDDTRNAFALSKLLADKGLKVQIAQNATKALELLESLPSVSLILTDIMMPGMDGYEFMRILRARVRYKKLPIIALTAKAMKGDREKCLKAGANDYLSKPIDPDRLFSMLRVWLSKE